MTGKKLLPILAILWVTTACTATRNNDKPLIVASFYAMQDLTSKIVGNKYEIVTLAGAGVEPHDYEPTAQDMQNMQDADLIVANGLGVEYWIDDLPSDLQSKTIQIGVDEKIVAEKVDNVIDPHVWLYPVYAEIEMKNIADKICDIDPENALYYQNRYQTYSKLFLNLDASFKSDFAPYKDRVFVTSHRSYNYFAANYGISNVALSGLSPEDEPSSTRLAFLIKQIKELEVSTVFYEEFSSASVAQTISKETGTRIDTLLTLESLNKDEQSSSDYIFLMRQNADKILASLGN